MTESSKTDSPKGLPNEVGRILTVRSYLAVARTESSWALITYTP